MDVEGTSGLHATVVVVVVAGAAATGLPGTGVTDGVMGGESDLISDFMSEADRSSTPANAAKADDELCDDFYKMLGNV